MRNGYNAITDAPAWVHTLIGALDGQAWTQGIETNKRGRGEAINVDVYAYCDARQLAVVQCRQCRITKYGNQVRKSYYLIGRNDNGNPFAHGIETVARNKKSLETNGGGVDLALSRIWGCEVSELPLVRRNGDIAFIPAMLPPDAVEVGDNGVTLRDSHVVQGEHLYRTPGGSYYVRGRASIKHVKGQHAAVSVRTRDAVYRVVVGHRAQTWAFSAPTVD